jgi:DNA-binding GntR family transcriptional regulator
MSTNRMSIDWTQHSLTVRQTYGDSLSATRHIRHMLLAAITAGDVAPGARFTETELGKQLGFSRTPLREAVAALKAEGIVETGEGGSLQVRVLAYHDIHALYEMRATLEGMAARLAATGASPAEKSFIDEIRSSETQLIKHQAPAAELARMNSKFHHSIFLASHNGFLLEALERLSQIMVLLGPTAYSLPARIQEIAMEHNAINNAIQSGQADDAEAATKRHLRNAAKARLHIIANQQRATMD